MKFNKSLLAISFALLSMVTGHASAALIDTVVSVPNDEILTNGNPTLVYTHDLSDHGFIVGSTFYSSGVLLVRLTDNGAANNPSDESGTITVGDQILAISAIPDGTRNDPSPAGALFEIILNSMSLADLNDDGMLSVTLDRITGNFAFADSTLTLVEREADVPEPFSIALLGAGVAGLCLSRRRERRT
ncbi:PEP-CTERM sorting domain-containing protein [Massilia sp. LjRoot122]|jgi:hypothetical protein|uniref:PEP-CTERM sorting domain-containing protein n=1 Tax=Massilia sp. LjRoot122 TaxID=3342257 RepID=UPI003ECD04B6